jgi:hypothetical protein
MYRNLAIVLDLGRIIAILALSIFNISFFWLHTPRKKENKMAKGYARILVANILYIQHQKC